MDEHKGCRRLQEEFHKEELEDEEGYQQQLHRRIELASVDDTLIGDHKVKEELELSSCNNLDDFDESKDSLEIEDHDLERKEIANGD